MRAGRPALGLSRSRPLGRRGLAQRMGDLRPRGREGRHCGRDALLVGQGPQRGFRSDLKPMTEILFYHLQQKPLEAVLPTLIEKSLERGWRAVVQATSA